MKFFRKLTLATLIAVYVLIMVGGIVRSTGSGMGCPDWPKCFGSWTPPTSVEQLPQNYKEIYSSYREKKNIRFAKYLSAFGFTETAEKIKTDPGILEEADFNATKTLVEYVNRIVGVIIGLLIFAVFVASIKFWTWDRNITLIAFATFVLVGFQGWIGSVVVSTNLTPWIVTVHMLLALLIVALLVYLFFESTKEKYLRQVKWGMPLIIVCMLLLLVQIVFGTQVREAVDLVSNSLPREGWIEAIGLPFIIHRSFSWLLLAVHAVLLWKLIKSGGSQILPNTLLVLIVVTIATGTSLAYFSMPSFLQPVHLTLASLTFGIQFLLALQLKSRSTEEI